MTFATLILMPKKTRPMTTADKDAAKRLRALFDTKQIASPEVTQESVAAELRLTQGALGQYLGGFIPIGVEATLKLAKYFHVSPTAIRPDFPYADMIALPGLSKEAIEVAQVWSQLPENARREFKRTVEGLVRLHYGEFLEKAEQAAGRRHKTAKA